MNKTVKITLLSAAVIVLVLILVGGAYTLGRSRGPFHPNLMTYRGGRGMSAGHLCPHDNLQVGDWHGHGMFDDMHHENSYFQHMDPDPWDMMDR
jgi:hypothetical protein